MDAAPDAISQTDSATLLPPRFADWFATRGWAPRRHQLAMIEAASQGQSALLIAPTGGGKTLAGFLPSLIALGDLPARPRGEGELHTLYISPLKALAVDIARNLQAPIGEMGLAIRVETRTGDTPANRRQRQKRNPPDILLTTPEQIALLLSYPDAPRLFASLRCIVLDELHAIINQKRGELLSLALARLARLAPEARRVGLSATVADPDRLRRYLMPQPPEGPPALARLIEGDPGTPPEVSILESSARVPWSGHTTKHAMAEIYDAINNAGTALIFVNTRSQAEFAFQQLWQLNEKHLPIALHHGSLSVGQRRKVEAAMAQGRLRAVVCTATLDLGIDWGAVDLVIHLGAPKGASRLVQRIGRANHRLDEPSRALLAPSNRFEVLECQAAREAVAEGLRDGEPPRQGGLDVLAQHLLGMGCAAPFASNDLYTEIRSADPFRHIDRDCFDRVVDFLATGGYALRRYERYWRLRRDEQGRWTVRDGRVAQQYRMNAGTIIEAPMLKIRQVKPGGGSRGQALRGGRYLGEIEEYFLSQLAPGDTFLFAGKVLRFEGLREGEAYASATHDPNPKIPSYMGGKFPLSSFLADRVRHLLASPDSWRELPAQVSEWLALQRRHSTLPAADQMLVECFPRNDKHYLICYPFEGRLAHQTLGMLLTRRLDRMGRHPMGFVATEYSLAVWGLSPMTPESGLDLDLLFDEDMLGDDLESWLAESSLMKRTFRACAIIAGLVETRFPGHEKTGRQVTFSSDLIYRVLHDHEPDHILMQAAWQDAATGLLDIGRLGDLLRRVRGRILCRTLARVSPLAVPVLLEIGRVSVEGEGLEAALFGDAEDFEAQALIAEATGDG